MRYVVTNEGLQILNSANLTPTLDEAWKNRFGEMWVPSFISEEDMKRYATGHQGTYSNDRISQTLNTGHELDEADFLLMSGILIEAAMSKFGKDIKARDLRREFADTATAYLLMRSDEFDREHRWRNNTHMTTLKAIDGGDLFVDQVDITPQYKGQLFKRLYRKDEKGFLADWSTVGTFLGHLLAFSAQTKTPAPYRDTWEQELFGGNFVDPPSDGRHEDHFGEMLMHNATGHGSLNKPPFEGGYEPYTLPVIGKLKEGGRLGGIGASEWAHHHAFINGGDLVYYKGGKFGFPYGWNRFGEKVVVLTPQDVQEAIKGTLKLVHHHLGRARWEDYGRIYKYFPFSRLQTAVA